MPEPLLASPSRGRSFLCPARGVSGFFSLAAVACRSPPVCDASCPTCPNSPALPSQIFAMMLSPAHLAVVEGGIFGKGLSVFCIARFAWSSVECGLVPNNPVSALFPGALPQIEEGLCDH